MDFYKDKVYTKDPKNNSKVIMVGLVANERLKMFKLEKFFKNIKIKGCHGLPHGVHCGYYGGNSDKYDRDHHGRHGDTYERDFLFCARRWW